MRVSIIGKEEITIRGTPDEIEALEGMANGAQWVKGDKVLGAVSIDAFRASPEPQDDPLIPAQWQRSEGTIAPGSARLIDHLPPEEGWHDPSFIVQHLCGYGFTPEKYKGVAVQMQQLGFECLRSRRARDGHFWEIWFLPGAWAAKGELADALKAIQGLDWRQTTEVVLNYLRKHVSFGTADVCVQRLAQVMCDCD